jgi:hypothetical protein
VPPSSKSKKEGGGEGMQLLAWRRNSQVKIIAAWLVFVMAVALMGISPVTDDNNLSAGSLKNLAIVSYSALEMDLAKVINKYTGYTWNQSQQKASKIVKLVLYGSDVTWAVGVVLAVLSAGTLTLIAAIVGRMLRWIILKKGRRAAVMW